MIFSSFPNDTHHQAGFKCWRGLCMGSMPLDTISFPGSRGSFRSETRMASKPLRRLQCRSITWTAPLPIPFSSIYGVILSIQDRQVFLNTLIVLEVDTLKVLKSCGPDEIPRRLLLEGACSLSTCMANPHQPVQVIYQYKPAQQETFQHNCCYNA